MKDSELSHLFILQNLHSSTATLAVMSDTTSRAISDMYNWPYSCKDEMKYLGGTLIKMREKFVEFSILGISKMVEDFFNNLERYGKIKISIWSPQCDSIAYLHEIRLIRHLGNVIKHKNSFIDSSTKDKSTKALIDKYGFTGDTSIHWLNIFQPPERDSILHYIYMANQFCTEILRREELLSYQRKEMSKEEAVSYILRYFVHSIPGRPERLI